MDPTAHTVREAERSHSHASLSSRTVNKQSEAAVVTMKRPNSSDSLISIFPSAGPLGTEFPPIMDGMEDDDCGEEDLCSSGHAAGAPSSEKKRRLSTDQVRALEKNFEVDNKLDPERKVRLAQELSLQPRQVAVWFQNRRARWKTKQLERDYSALRSSYDALRLDYDSIRHDNQALAAEIKELKAKLGEEESSYSSVKEEEQVVSESELKPSEVEEETPPPPTAVEAALIYKDGSSDSDTSAVLNDDTSPYHPMFACSPAILSTYPPAFTISAPNGSQFWSSEAARARGAAAGLSIGFSFHHQTKAEEHGFELPCSSFFSDEQPWHYSDQWSWMDGGGGDHSNIGRREGLS